MPDNLVSFDPSSTPHTLIDATLAGVTPANPSAIDLAVAPKPLAAPAAPAEPTPGDRIQFDPSAESFTPAVPAAPKVHFNPVKDAHEKIFTLDDLKNTPADQLDNTKEFEPTDFGFQHKDEILADPEAKAKLLEVYKLRNQPLHRTKQFLSQSPGEIAKQSLGTVVYAPWKIIGGALHVGSDIGRAIWGAAQHAGGAFLGAGLGAANDLLGNTKAANEAFSFAGSQGGELLSGLEAESAAEIGLGGRSLRSAGELAAKYDPTGFVSDMTGAKSPDKYTPADWEARFVNDIAEKQTVQELAKGSGYLVQAIVGNKDELKQAGITIDPQAVEKLMPATSLLNFIPLGEGLAVGAVGKVGGRFVVEQVARAATREQASAFIQAVNRGSVLAGRAAESGGKVLQEAGKNLREKIFKPLHNLGDVAGLGAIAGGHGPLGAAVLGVTKFTPKALELAGKGLQAAAPFTAGAVRVGADALGEAAKGYAHGLFYTLPFMVGATPTEQDQLLNVAALAGAVRGGVRGAGLTGQIAGFKAQEVLASKIFEHVKQAEPPPVPDYGTDLALDSASRVNEGNLSQPQKNFLGWAKHLFKDSGVEFYPLTDSQFLQQTGGQGGRGFAVKLGQTIAPDGTVKPLTRIFLNGSVDALPHEMLHALGNIDAPGYQDFVKSVNDTLTPQERGMFEQIYNHVQNGGKPEAQWTHRLTPQTLNEEVAAEIFSRIVLGQDLRGVEPGLVRKASLFASGLLEKMGVPLGDVNPVQAKDINPRANRPGFSTLGLRPTAEAVGVGQDFIRGLLGHLKASGDLLGPEPTSAIAGGPVTGRSKISKKGPAGPAGPTPIKPGPAPVPGPSPAPKPTVPIPLPSAPAGPRNLRVSRAKQNDFAARRFEQTKIDEAKAVAEKNGNPEVVKHVDEISKAVETGTPLEIEYQSVKNAGGEEQPSGRSARRTEQENAYIAEGMGAAPADVRELAQKVTVPVRWETVAGKPQLLAMSLDKVVANVHKVVKEASAHSVEARIPYEARKGTLTPDAWRQVVQDFQDYANNQANGYRGDGQKLTRPTEDIGVSIPAENPDYTPVHLTEDKMNFLNMVQGLNPPLTAREVKGAVPGNVKGQILAEINARQPQKPTVIAPKDIQKQTFKTSGREIMETNPLRNELAAAGVPVRSLIEVTERLSTENIEKVTPRPDLNIQAPVTDTIRGGFLPGGEEGGATRFLRSKTTAQIGRGILEASPEQWQEMTSEVGGLTNGAYKLGHRLTDPADVQRLRDFEAEARIRYEDAKASQDFDGMMRAATQKQFFTEALETATGSSPGKQATIGRVLGPSWQPPFPSFPEAPDASGALPGNKFAEPNAPVGSVGEGFNPPELPRQDNSALALPVEGVDSPVRYAGDKDGLTPMRFLPGEAPGDEHTPASPSYPDADRLARQRGGNAWVRQSAEASNKERVLLVQFTPDLMYPNGPDPVSTPYYDKLYSGVREGYSRATDFWELPQWVAVATENLGSKADFYAVRNMEEAKKFLAAADYGRVAFSVMDVSKAVTEELVPHIKGQVDLGGYTDRTGAVAKNPNAKIWDSMNAFVESTGVPYRKGFDYRHFRGTEIIPRLELSAGCRHRCTFCTIDRVVTNSPLEEINTQVDSFHDLNAKLVYLNDKTFGQSPNVAEMPRLFKEMKAANPEFEGFVIQTTAAQMRSFTDKFLKDSGIRYVELGVETYNDPILKELRKPATEKLIDESVEKLRRNKINFIPNIVIGFPGETAATYGRTMDFLNKNSDVISHLNTYNLAVYEGTEISKKIETKTAADADENSFQKSFYADPKVHEDFAKDIYDFGTKQLGKETPFPGSPEGQLLPKTDSGRRLFLDGYDFRISGQPGVRAVTVLKDGVAIGEFQSAQRTPGLAEISNVQIKAQDRGKGVGEAAYRELLTQLKADGITQVEGTIVAPEPLALRKKIFGGFDKLELNGTPVSIDDAIRAANKLKSSRAREVTNIEATNTITPDMQFLPGSEGVPEISRESTPGSGIESLAEHVAASAGLSNEPAEVARAGSEAERIAARSALSDEATKQPPAGLLLPKKREESKLRPEDIQPKPAIKSPAVKLDNGDIVEAPMHFMAMEKALEDNPKYKGGFDHGFTTTKPGEFLNSDQALVRAEDIKQLKPFTGLAKSIGFLESKEFEKNRKFLPEIRRDDRGRPLTDEGLIDYERLYKEMTSKRAREEASRNAEDLSKYSARGREIPEGQPTVVTGWILPNQEFIPLSTAFHEQYLANNAEDLNRRFGTTLKSTPDVEDRLQALNKGFIRIRSDNNGNTQIEMNARYFSGAQKRGLTKYLLDRKDDFNKVTVSLLNNKAGEIDSVTVNTYSTPGKKRAEGILGALDTLRPRSGGQSLPGGEGILPGLNLPSEEKAKQLRVKARVSKSRDKFPEALKLQYRKDDAGKFVLDENGKPKAQAVEYGLADSPLGRIAAHGLKGEDRTRAVEQDLGKKLVAEGRAALKQPDLQAGAKWYSTARTRLRKLFGDDSKFFTELLGATSARTPVEVNYRFALDAYNRFKKGEYADILRKYREGKTNWDARKIDDFFAANPGNTNPTRGQFLDWWVEANNLGPRQSNGKKFGANSRQVLKVLDGSWRDEIGGPKTPNFAGNLSGDTFQATVDVWAARLLHRLANVGNEKPWRILPEMETGVTDEDFNIGQGAYRYAAEKLGMKPDALQAVLWFREKQYWEERGWTRGAGAEKSDFNVLLKETEPTGTGTFRMKNPQNELALDINPGDIKKK